MTTYEGCARRGGLCDCGDGPCYVDENCPFCAPDEPCALHQPTLADGFPASGPSDKYVEAMYQRELLDRLTLVTDLIEKTRFSYSNERELQEALAGALSEEFQSVKREVRLDSRNRIDIIVQDEIGIEVKVKGNSAAALKQCIRYTGFEQIKALVLVTNRATHALPLEIHGKPVRVVSLLHQGL